MFIDSHIHLSHRGYDNTFGAIGLQPPHGYELLPPMNRGELIELMIDNHIGGFVDPGINLESNYRLLELHSQYPDRIFPAVGIHPTRVKDTPFRAFREIKKLSALPQVVAIGELGLDFHHPRKDQHRLRQYLWFLWQLRLAHKRKLPLILHIRMADRQAIPILRMFKKKIHGGVCHCFRGDASTARIYTEELGLMLGIGGSLLQQSRLLSDLEEAVRVTPLESILLETDGPYVAPSKPEEFSKNQWQKAKNTSLILPQLAQRIGELKGVPASAVEKITTENAIRLFTLISN